VFQQPDVDGNIYRLPFLTLPIVEFVSRRLGLDVSIGGERLTCLAAYADRVGGRKVRVALAGKYHGGADTYRSVEEALRHASSFLGLDLEILAATTKNDVASSAPHGVVAPGGFGRRGFEDIVEIASDCRVARRPFLGLCLGMQAAAVEAVRATGKEADSAEFVHDARVVAAWDGLGSGVARPGGPPPMRLGARAVIVTMGTTLHSVYGGTGAMERHRHRYAVNPDYESVMNRAGLVVSATSAEGVIEAVEARQHPFYVGVQYHPELLSRFDCPHPLFVRFLGAASEAG
jgi:CTP synthase